MQKLRPSDLMPLEQYARERQAFRARVIAHKASRRVAVGPNATWCFEDRLTIQYQVQEMLRTERIFEPQGIADEDLERENAEKTSSVHFLRFELSDAMVAALRAGARLAMGVDHPAYPESLDTVSDPVRAALLADFS